MPDKRIDQLTELTTADDADEFVVWDDSASETKRITRKNVRKDVTVAEGGTGVTALTDGGVLLGSGADAITPMAVLADSEFIVGNGTTDPVAESGATVRTSMGVGTGNAPEFNGLKIGSGTRDTEVHVELATAGLLASIKVEHTNNANTGSNAQLHVQVGGVSGGDPSVRYDVTGATTWTHGIDNSDGDAWVISNSGAIGTNNAIRVSTAEEVTMPAQPAFLAYNSVIDSNVTGNGTEATVDFNIEVFDQGADFAADTFTAPVAGRYLLVAEVRVLGVTSAADQLNLSITTSNRKFENVYIFTNNIPSDHSLILTAIADMDAADTATVTVKGIGEASDVIDIVGDSSPRTSFSGCLLA